MRQPIQIFRFGGFGGLPWQVWDLRTGTKLHSPLRLRAACVTDLHFSRDGQGIVTVWNGTWTYTLCGNDLNVTVRSLIVTGGGRQDSVVVVG